GDFTYTISNLAVGSSYLVRMHFAETGMSPGQRLFNVWVNGSRVLRNFDVVATAGATYRAVVREVLAVADSTGRVTLQFVSVKNPARLNGLEVLPRAVSAVDAGGAAAGLYAADTGFSGGTAASTTATIDTNQVSDPAPQAVYQSERYGTFRYTMSGL